MNKTLKTIGAPSMEELRCSAAFPEKKDYQRGPIAIIECTEEIPCNPCETVCPKGAIKVGDPITNLPTIDFDLCSGCGICAAKCPGLAIYILDVNYTENEALIMFPFEYLPFPERGETVSLVNRLGDTVCPGRVESVLSSKSYDHTTLISVAFPKQYYEDVVSMKKLG